MRSLLLVFFCIAMSSPLFAQTPPIEPGVPQELARWRAARYSDVRYKLNLTLEKMSPVLKGTIEIRVKVGDPAGSGALPIVLDWRKIKGHEDKSVVSNVSINGRAAGKSDAFTRSSDSPGARGGGTPEGVTLTYGEENEHLIFRDGVVAGENVIKLDFTSPILPSGSAITRYVDKEDGSEYIYSLFVPSDASTAFPVFDQPDLKARFELTVTAPADWTTVANSLGRFQAWTSDNLLDGKYVGTSKYNVGFFAETKPISTYVFAFAAGPWEKVSMPGGVGGNLSGSEGAPLSTGPSGTLPTGRVTASAAGPWERVSSAAADKSVPPAIAGGEDVATRDVGAGGPRGVSAQEHVMSGAVPPANAGGTDKMAGLETSIFVRKSQAAKFRPHAAEVFRLNREAVKYFEQYFDYKFPFPKYDLVLIPEFPFGGMEHAGATFLREASIIFPQEPTKNDHISRATLIFHEAAHQWFGDTVTMRWFDDLWLKEGFATFTAYKALEKIMPEMNAWKVFYERIKQGAYQTDSTRGTTAIYQPIANLSAAKSAYGNIVYNKAPAFLRQAEFYLGEDKFQTAVRAFLKKHEYGNAGWEDLVKEFENVKVAEIKGANYFQKLSDLDKTELEKFSRWSINREFAEFWVTKPGLAVYRVQPGVLEGDRLNVSGGPTGGHTILMHHFTQKGSVENYNWLQDIKVLKVYDNGDREIGKADIGNRKYASLPDEESKGLRRGEFTFSDAIPSYDPDKVTPKVRKPLFVIPNYQDYGYGIFLLDEKSRDYVLKNIQNEKDPFLRTMMWGALWDSVREGELDPRVFVELVVKVLGASSRAVTTPSAQSGGHPSLDKEGSEEDESTVATLLGRVGTALNYYIEDGSVSSPHVSKGSTSSAGRVEPSLTAPTPRGDAPAGAPGVGLRTRVEDLLIERMRNAPTAGERITFYRVFLNVAASERARMVLRDILNLKVQITDSKLRTKDKFDIVTKLLILGDAEAPKILAELERTETGDDAKRYAYAARAGIGTAGNKAKYWDDFVSNKEISESWIEAGFGPWNSIRHSDLTLSYLRKALQELPNHKRDRKIFFVNGWLGAFIGGQRSEEALAIVNKFLADNPGLDNDLRLKILENADLIERAVNIRRKFPQV